MHSDCLRKFRDSTLSSTKTSAFRAKGALGDVSHFEPEAAQATLEKPDSNYKSRPLKRLCRKPPWQQEVHFVFLRAGGGQVLIRFRADCMARNGEAPRFQAVFRV